jgi:hypothetical protein
MESPQICADNVSVARDIISGFHTIGVEIGGVT